MAHQGPNFLFSSSGNLAFFALLYCYCFIKDLQFPHCIIKGQRALNFPFPHHVIKMMTSNFLSCYQGVPIHHWVIKGPPFLHCIIKGTQISKIHHEMCTGGVINFWKQKYIGPRGSYKIFDDQNVGSHKMTTDSVFILFKKTDFNTILDCLGGRVYQ